MSPRTKSDIRSSPRYQRGIAAVLAVIFLITAVVFVLVQSLSITGTTSIDNKQQLNSTRALFLAESGLEAAGHVMSEAAKGTFSAGNCCIGTGSPCATTNTLPSDSQSLAAGTYKFVSATPACNAAGLNCTTCTVEVKGMVGTTTRQLQRVFNISASQTAAFCNPSNAATTDCSNSTANPPSISPTWALTLGGATGLQGVGFFNMGADKSTGASNLSCLSGLSCLATGNKQWETSSGSTVLGLGNTVLQNSTDQVVFQRLSDQKNDVVLTGALFPAVGIKGDVISIPGGIANSAVGSGSINAGSVTNGVMTVTSSSYGLASPAWCDAGNTLVMGYSSNVSSGAKNNTLNNVSFNGVALSNIDINGKLLKMPTASDASAADTVSSEIWYKSNPIYSYGKWIDALVVEKPVSLDWKLSKCSPNCGGTATLNSGNPSGILVVGSSVGDGLCPSKTFDPGTTIIGFNSDCLNKEPQEIVTGLVLCFSGTNPHNSSNSCKGNAIGTTALEVKYVNGGTSAADIDSILNGDTVVGSTIQSGTTIVSKLRTDSPYIATYQISKAALSDSEAEMVVGGATISGNKVYLNGNALGGVSPKNNQVIAARNLGMGTNFNGKTMANTIASAGSSTEFTITTNTDSKNSAKNGAVICGGTCALFDGYSSTTTTSFNLGSLPAGTNNWVAGFVCLKDVGIPSAIVGGNSAVNLGRWMEIVQ